MSIQHTVSYVLTLSCPDRPGIVHAVSGLLATNGANIVESQQYGDPISKLFFMRVEFETSINKAVLETKLATVSTEFSMSWNLHIANVPTKTLIMVSTAAHCLNDLLFRQHTGELGIEVAAVVGNHKTLQPLADFYHQPFHHIPISPQTKAQAQDQLREIIESNGVELIVLARYMQVLSDDFCRDYEGRIINIHHSFLPSFKGARPYHQAHSRGVKLIGATSHYVTADLDEGPIIEQDVTRVNHSHNANELVSMGQDVERQVLSRAVRWHVEHRVLLNGDKTVVFQ